MGSLVVAFERASRPGAALALAVSLLVAGCSGEDRPVHRGPVVVVTLDGLRIDVVGALGGAPGLTPALDALCREATWAGAAVAPSSWTVPSMASLMTGLAPWQHGALYGERAQLRSDLVTLAEALRRVGYATAAFRSNYWTRRQFGYAQGFDLYARMRRGERAKSELLGLEDGATLLWLDLPEPSPPYVWSAGSVAAVRRALGDEALPETPLSRAEPADLEPYFDPARSLSAERQRQFWTLYLMSVRSADRELEEMLSALRRSGRWDDTLLVVTSTHGTTFGEDGRVGAGGSLDRSLIEVPLVIKLPARFPRSLRLADGERPALRRLFSTLVEAVGGAPVPAALPSLFRETEGGVLSELYRDNGSNHFSWVREGRQLVWSVRFAPDEPNFFDAGLVLQGLRPADSLDEPAEVIFGRLDAAFRRQHPLYGIGEPPELRLVDWNDGRAPYADGPELRLELTRQLEAAWCRHGVALDELTVPSSSCPLRAVSPR